MKRVHEISGAEPTPRRRSASFGLVAVATLANAAWFIWSNRFLPISDYPDWVYQGTIIARMLRGESVSHFSLKPYPIPYSSIVATLGILDLIFPPEISGKIVLTLLVLLFALASIYLLESFQDDETNPLLYVPLLFVLNCWFFWGELFYLSGLTLMLLCLGYLFRRLDRLETIGSWLILTASCALFFCHLLPYLTAMLVVAVVILPRSNFALIRKFLVASLPSIAMTLWYVAARTLTGSLTHNGLWVPWTSHLIAGRLLAAFSPYPEFLPWLGIQFPAMQVAAALDVILCAVFSSFCFGCFLFGFAGAVNIRSCSERRPLVWPLQ